MTQLVSLCLVIFFSTTAFTSFKLTNLGERSNQCQKLDSDDYIVTVDNTLKRETQNLFDDDKLSTLILTQPECFRVGTEIKIFLENETIPYLGKALIDEIEVLTRSELLSKKQLPLSSYGIQDFVAKNQSNNYGIFKIHITEKVTDYFVDQQYERLPTCFPTYGDWESFRVSAEEKSMVNKIKSGQTIAQIWNGTFNCYKVGIRARIQVEGESNIDHGNVIPNELHVVHLTRLSSKHARLLGTSLSDLRQQLEDKKDVDGGYITLVVFDYEKPREEEDAIGRELNSPENN